MLWKACFYRCWWQQLELHLLWAPDALTAALTVRWPVHGAVGPCHTRRLLYHGLRLPQCPRAHHWDGQWPGHLPAQRARVQRSASTGYWIRLLSLTERLLGFVQLKKCSISYNHVSIVILDMLYFYPQKRSQKQNYDSVCRYVRVVSFMSDGLVWYLYL